MHLIKSHKKASGFGKPKTTALTEKVNRHSLAKVLLVGLFLLSFTFIGLSIILSEEI